MQLGRDEREASGVARGGGRRRRRRESWERSFNSLKQSGQSFAASRAGRWSGGSQLVLFLQPFAHRRSLSPVPAQTRCQSTRHCQTSCVQRFAAGQPHSSRSRPLTPPGHGRRCLRDARRARAALVLCQCSSNTLKSRLLTLDSQHDTDSDDDYPLPRAGSPTAYRRAQPGDSTAVPSSENIDGERLDAAEARRRFGAATLAAQQRRDGGVCTSCLSASAPTEFPKSQVRQ